MHEKAAPLKSPEPRHGREKLEVFHKQKSLDSLDGSLRLNETLKDEDIKKCHREVAASKYNSQYHKLFKDIPTEESVLKVCSCALQRDILIQGRLYISPNWLCFYANLFGKDIKVVIPVVSVQLIKKHKTARLLPNGLAITTTASRKYIFVSLISRDSVYDVLRRVCTHLQVSSKKSLSLKELSEEPDSVSLGTFLPYLRHAGEFQVTALSFKEWRRQQLVFGAGVGCVGRSFYGSRNLHSCGAIMEDQLSLRMVLVLHGDAEVIVPEGKWRKVSPTSLSLSLPDANYQCIHRTSVSSLSAKESSFTSEEPLVSESAINTEEELEVEQSCVAELRPSDYQLLKIFIVLICLLVVSSSYLAFRIFRLEQQLCSLNRDYLSRGHRR
ncbi:hypothetical protein Nmel_013384 [Mimus melanotis]